MGAHRLQSRVWRRLIDDLPEALVLINAADGRVALANHVARRIVGFDLVGQVVAELGLRFSTGAGERLDNELHPFLGPLLTGVAVTAQDVRITLPNNRVINALVNSAPVYSGEGEVVGAVAIFQDVSEQKSLERLREDFLSIAGHELRTPLASLKGWAQFAQLRLNRGQVSDPRTLLVNVNRQISRIEALLDQLLDAARIQREGMTLETALFDVDACLRGLVENLTPDWSGRVVYRRTRPAYVEGDRARLERVVLNLLVNALKYSPPETTVRLMVLRSETRVAIGVLDRGIGIPQDEIPHIFERFYRAQNTSHGGGLGLGLFIASEIVRAHEGSLLVRSEQGKGTLFCASLPITQPERAGQWAAD